MVNEETLLELQENQDASPLFYVLMEGHFRYS